MNPWRTRNRAAPAAVANGTTLGGTFWRTLHSIYDDAGGRMRTDRVDETVRGRARNEAARTVERMAAPDVLYSVHDVDLETRTASPAMLWSGAREPTGDEISEATAHEGGIVRRMTRQGAEWEFGGGWRDNAHHAISAALP